jgi:hypothetical protein
MGNRIPSARETLPVSPPGQAPPGDCLESNDRSISARQSARGDAMSASYEVRGSVAVITMNNPPVNGLGYATRVASPTGWTARPPTRRCRRW